jgi:DNA-binding transcriptional LysR family regulator
VRVGTLVSNDATLLAIAIGAAYEEQRDAGYRIRIVEGIYEELLGQLTRGEIDVLIARGRDDPRSDDVTTEVLFQENFSVVCGIGNCLARQSSITPSGLLQAGWVLPPSASLVRRNIDLRLLADCGRKPQRVVEASSVFSTLALITHGDFVGIMPPRTALEFQARGQLHILPYELGAVGGPMVLLKRSTNSPAPAVESFLRVLKSEAQRLDALRDENGEIASPPDRQPSAS